MGEADERGIEKEEEKKGREVDGKRRQKIKRKKHSGQKRSTYNAESNFL